MQDAFIVAAKRTPIGKLNGAFAGIPASELGACVIRALLAETNLQGGSVSEIIMGQALMAGAGQNPARQAAIRAGVPAEVPAMTINKVCGAGQKSIHLAAQAIRCGDADIVIAGGQDSMSEAPHLVHGVRRGLKHGHYQLMDSMILDGLWDAFYQLHMGITAEALARRYRIKRLEQDEFSLASQKKAKEAIETLRFTEEIVVVDRTLAGRGRPVLADEHPNPNSSIERLSALRPAFVKDGTVTAGNSSGLNDGAAAVVIVSGRKLAELGLNPLARIASYASAGVAPMEMGLGPVVASRSALIKAGWRADSLDLTEINEAFAAQAIAVNRELDWDPATMNVNGGAIALGHPLAGSGCRIVVTLLHEMVRRGAKRGLASLCIGGGLGVTICLER